MQGILGFRAVKWGVFVTSVLILSHIFSIAVASECNLIEPNVPVPEGYGAPYSLFTSPSSLLFTITCNPEQVLATVGNGKSNTYIYQSGYEWVAGAWKKFDFKGQNQSGSWITGLATANLTPPASGKNGNAVAYFCEKSDGQWKCGCRDSSCQKSYWQLQKYKMVTQTLAPVTNDPRSVLSGITDLMIAYPDKYSVSPGGKITINGAGFSKEGNDVLLGKKIEIRGVVTKNSSELTFKVPADTPFGLYNLAVRVGTKVATTSAPLVVKDPAIPDPIVTSVSPSKINYGDEVTIMGAGFTKTDNVLHTTFGSFEGIASPNGTTLKVRYSGIEAFDKALENATSSNAFVMPVYVTVANQNGVSKADASTFFNLTITR